MIENEGSCGCGVVKYIVKDDPSNIINCHCYMCKNHNGSAFSTYAIYPVDSFKIMSGREFLSKYIANDGEKNFCKQCGTPIFNAHNKYSNVVMVYYGTLKLKNGLIPNINVWSENQMSWVNKMSEIKSVPQG